MGKFINTFCSWEGVASFGKSFVKGALLGVPVALVVLGVFGALDTFGFLTTSIQSMNNLPALLTFNTIFSGASLAVMDGYSRYNQNTQPTASLTPQHTTSPTTPDIQIMQTPSIQSSRTHDIKRAVMNVSDIQHDGHAAPQQEKQYTIH